MIRGGAPRRRLGAADQAITFVSNPLFRKSIFVNQFASHIFWFALDPKSVTRLLREYSRLVYCGETEVWTDGEAEGADGGAHDP